MHSLKAKTSETFNEYNFPISKDQWLILERITAKRGSSQKDIAKDTFKDPTALTRMLDLLVSKGFIQRKASKTDHRTFNIYTTVDDGRLAKQIAPKLDTASEEIEKKFTTEEKKKFEELLSRLH